MKIVFKQYKFILIIFILAVAFGLYSFLTMPKTEDPLISKPGAFVTVIYPGANQQILENTVVKKVEDGIREVGDLKNLETTIVNNGVLFKIEFSPKTKAAKKYEQIVKKINQLRSKLPKEISEININAMDITNITILQIGITSESASYSEIEDICKKLKDKIMLVEGINQIDIVGIPKRQVTIALDFEKIAMNNISLKQVVGSIKNTNVAIPAGELNLKSRVFNVIVNPAYNDIQDIKNTLIFNGPDKTIFLKDIADIKYDVEKVQNLKKVNGKKAAFVTISQKKGYNIFKIRENINKSITGFKDDLPAHISLDILFDQSLSVSRNIKSFSNNMRNGILVVGLVIFLVIGFKSAFLVMIVLPVSVFFAVGCLSLCGPDFSLNQVTIAGLIISLGLLVDNAIVLIEMVNVYRKKGLVPLMATKKAVAHIKWPITASTITTIFAFIPIIMMKDSAGDYLRGLPVIVVFTLIASLLAALYLLPIFTGILAKNKSLPKATKAEKLFHYISKKYYRPLLKKILINPKKTFVIIIGIVMFTVFLASFLNVAYFPKAQKSQFLINIRTNPDSSLEKTENIAKDIEEYLLDKEEIKSIASNIGDSNPLIYYNQILSLADKSFCQILVNLNPLPNNKNQEFISELRAHFKNYKKADIEIKEFIQGPPLKAPIVVWLYGNDPQKLINLALDVQKELEALPGVININNPIPKKRISFKIAIDQQQAANYGVFISVIQATLRIALSGMNVSSFVDNKDNSYDIAIQSNDTSNNPYTILEKLYVTSQINFQVPLKQLCKIELKSEPITKFRYNFKPAAILTADVLNGHSVDKTTKRLINRLEKLDFPKDYGFDMQGELKNRQTSFAGMKKASTIAVLAIFAVLVFQFRSLLQPLIILTALPFAVVGSVIALLLAGQPFSFTAFIGLTSLIGIVVNDAILLVEQINIEVKNENVLIEAICKAAESRFLPVLITSITTIAGLIPLTISGSDLWAPLGWTIIGGLFSSTLLTLLLVPFLYKNFKLAYNSVGQIF
ncbi:efflux RND transporter permease subunit [Candidatus Margulisiibacteriota bacterium]